MTTKLLLVLACSAFPFAMAADILKTSTALFSAISEDCTNRGQPNFVFSPYSILGVFHVAQRGAAGHTKKQMDALVPSDAKFDLPIFDIPSFYELDQPVKVETANRIYAHRALKGNDSFLDFAKKVSATMVADVKTIDFANESAAASEMNAFVEEKTRGHINHLIDASTLSPTTKMVLVNALYFKAPWNSKFDKDATYEDVFHARTAEGPQEQLVLFMKQRVDDGITYLKENGLTAFSLPYADKRLRLFVYMPEDIEAFETKVAEKRELLEDIAKRVQRAHLFDKELELSLPKFKLSAAGNRFDLEETFNALGSDLMFIEGGADFSGMTGNRDLYVSTYVHQADIEVDENGTEASAATVVGIMAMSMPEPPSHRLPLKVDKPFVFQVRFDDEKRSFVLFAGRVKDVKAAQ